MSHQIKRLEDELGVVLLTRNRRQVTLTDARALAQALRHTFANPLLRHW